MIVNGVFGDVGKKRRLQKFFNDGKCVLVPLDDSLISGPEDGLLDIKAKVSQIESAHPNAIMAFSGTLSVVKESSIPLILNLTASTVIGQHTNKVLVSSVERAVALDADAVALHINFSSRYESEMLRNVERVKEKCNLYGMPLMILAYPRTERTKLNTDLDGDNNYLDLKKTDNAQYTRLVSHCVRIAFELGADIIKAQYTGDSSSFSQVVKSAVDIPVLIAGGKPESHAALFNMVRGAIDAGASGVSIGRYVFNDKHSDVVIRAIKKIVFDGISANEAESYYKAEASTR